MNTENHKSSKVFDFPSSGRAIFEQNCDYRTNGEIESGLAEIVSDDSVLLFSVVRENRSFTRNRSFQGRKIDLFFKIDSFPCSYGNGRQLPVKKRQNIGKIELCIPGGSFDVIGVKKHGKSCSRSIKMIISRHQRRL